MNMFAFSGLLWSATTLSLSIFVLLVGKTRIHRAWAAFNLAITIWAFGYAMAAMSNDAASASFWWRFAHIGGNVNSVILLNLACILGGIKRRALLTFGYIYSSIFVIYGFMRPSGEGLQYIFNSFYYPSTSFYAINPSQSNFPIFLILFYFYVFYGLFELWVAYKKSSGIDRVQNRWFLFGELTGFVGGGICYSLPIFDIDWYPYWNFTVPIYFMIATYAIFRHKMLDIEVIIRKTIVFAGLLASVFAILILPTLLIQEYILRSATLGSRTLGLMISGAIIILTMRKMEDLLINITDKYLFQKKYNYKELLKTFTSEVLMVLEMDKLVNLTVTKLVDIIKINSSAVLLLDEDKQQFNVMASHNIKDPQLTLVRPGGIVTFLEDTQGCLLVSELKEKKTYIPVPIQDIIDKLNAELIIPMVMHEKVMGILSLGKKKSDENYTQDDLDIILSLARTLAIAISNAQLFDELGKTQAEAAQKEKMAVIGTLSAGINHEICNPLGIARGQCEAYLLNLKDGLYASKTPEELLKLAHQIMNKVIKEVDRATAITKKLSSFAKPAKGEAEMVDIEKEMEDVMGLVGYELKLEKIEFEKNIEPNIPNIFVDRKQFQEVLFNLIRNAGQAIGDRGKITLSARHNNGRVYIDIQDTGSGIPEDKLKLLFNPFFTTKEPGKGTGLGLFIVRQVIEKNEGRIHLKSTKVGEGTTFTVEFPVAVQQEAKV